MIADYVVAALKNLFTDADIRASSDRYLRNAIIAVLAYDRDSTLWDAARLLSVGEEGYAYRRSVGARVRTLPEFKEISEFFTAELTAQLADARSTTTAKLDAPVNKLARLLNSPSIKRVLLNDSLRVDFDEVIAGEQVLVVKGALGAMGAGNTSVLMQLLVGMLDAALARQQDLVRAERRVAVALKIDEAPLVINRGFAETMALKRSAGLETVACWQTDAQWADREVRDQLDALFAHRVYFATASARDARRAAELTMAEFSDTVRPGVERLSSLGHPDVRLHLPKHHAIASWATAEGRQPPFVAETIPLRVDRERIALHAARQRARGGRHRTDLRQPHWDRTRAAAAGEAARADGEARGQRSSGAGAAPSRPLDCRSCPAAQPASYRELAELERRTERALGAAAALALVARARAARSRDARAGRRAAARAQQPAPPPLQPGTRRHHDPASAQAALRRGPRRALPVSSPRRGRDPDVLRDHRSRPARSRPRRLAETHPSRRPAARCTGGRARASPRQARHDVHVAGWALALAGATGGPASPRGAEAAVLRSHRALPARPGGARAGRPAAAGRRAPHDFLRTDASGERVEVERFETVRPDAIVELTARTPTGGRRPRRCAAWRERDRRRGGCRNRRA